MYNQKARLSSDGREKKKKKKTCKICTENPTTWIASSNHSHCFSLIQVGLQNNTKWACEE